MPHGLNDTIPGFLFFDTSTVGMLRWNRKGTGGERGETLWGWSEKRRRAVIGVEEKKEGKTELSVIGKGEERDGVW